jgi:hypothetical protein
MKRNQIDRAFANAFGGIARSFGCTNADVSGSAANVFPCAGASGLGWLRGILGGN